MISHKEKKEFSQHIKEATKHETKILVIILINSYIIEKLKDKFQYLSNIIVSHSFVVESFCTYLAAYILVIFETLILTRIKSKLFFISRRTALTFAILIVFVGSFYTALASEHMGRYEIAAQAGLMVLSAIAVWKAPTISEDKILLKSLMTTIPATSLTVATVLAVSLVLNPPTITPEIKTTTEIKPHLEENDGKYLDNDLHLNDNIYNSYIYIGVKVYI
jgi:hypothetical protein